MAVSIVKTFDVSAKRERGVVKELVRAVIVSGLTGTDADSYVEQISAASAVDAVRGSITVDGAVLWYEGETIRIGDDVALGDAQVDITYARGEGTPVTSGGSTYLVPKLRGGTTLRQVETEVDYAGDAITVTYTYPADSKEVAPDGTSLAGETVTQRGKIRVTKAMRTLEGSIRVQTNDPGAITDEYANHVNLLRWQGGAPRTWKCTSATFELVDDSQSTPIWDFFFRFEYDPKTWDDETTAAFIMPSGNIPDDATVGDGFTQVQYYPTKDFAEDFGGG